MTRKLATVILLALLVATGCYGILMYHTVAYLPTAPTALVVWLSVMPGVLTGCLVAPEIYSRRVNPGSWMMLAACAMYLTTAYTRNDYLMVANPDSTAKTQLAQSESGTGQKSHIS